MSIGVAPRPAWVGKPPLPIDGCTCRCHRYPGIYHAVPCCGVGVRSLAPEFVGLAELLGETMPLPEVNESNSPMAWLMWDLAVEARDRREAA